MEQSSNAAALPESIGKALDRFCDRLEQALGDALVSVVLYSDLAVGEPEPGSSEVSVMVVLNRVDVELLDRAAPVVRDASRDCGLTALVLTEDDLRRSTDVFPIKFLDMQRHHRLLRGKDVLADLPIARDHLRLRCEQELKNLMLRLRRLYLLRSGRPAGIEGTLVSAVSALRNALAVLAELKTGQASDDDRNVVSAAERLGLAAEPIRSVLALQGGKHKPDSAELKRIYGAFMQTVQQAAHLADVL